MLLFTISLNLFIILVMVGLGIWGVYVLFFVGGRPPKKTKRPMPGPYTFFHPTTTGGGGTFEASVPLSAVNVDELRLGIIDLANPKATPSPASLPITHDEEPSDQIPDDNPDFAILEEEFTEETETLAKPRQVQAIEATAQPLGNPSPITIVDLDNLTLLDEDVLNQVEAIFGNVDQMDLLDYYHTETNRQMLQTGEDYHTVFYRLIQNEPEENRTYLTSMLVPPGTPEEKLSMATVLAMGDEEEVDF